MKIDLLSRDQNIVLSSFASATHISRYETTYLYFICCIVVVHYSERNNAYSEQKIHSICNKNPGLGYRERKEKTTTTITAITMKKI